MKLKALDQVSLSAVKSGIIAPGEEFEVSDAAGQELLDKRPGLFERMAEPKKTKAEKDAADDVADKAEAPETKSEPAPKNKAESGPAQNKGKALFGGDDKADKKA